MGEERTIVESFPVDELPEKLRVGLEAGGAVRIIFEPKSNLEPLPSLASYIGTARGVYASPEDVLAEIRKLRDEWE